MSNVVKSAVVRVGSPEKRMIQSCPERIKSV
ncbi:Uncharacterised protein [Vibrio cholerae]|nr:Uncharacterised protein [Vibrio cholerae]